MMLCRADFEELFPELFGLGDTCNSNTQSPDDCDRCALSSDISASGMSVLAPAAATTVFLMMPAVAAWSAAWVIFTSAHADIRLSHRAGADETR